MRQQSGSIDRSIPLGQLFGIVPLDWRAWAVMIPSWWRRRWQACTDALDPKLVPL
jgi:hypothetical protein